MILPTALLVVAVAIAAAAPRAIPRGFSSGRHPGSELMAWQAASWSVLLCTISAFAILALPWLDSATSLPRLLERCLQGAGSSDAAWLPLAGRIAFGSALIAVVVRLAGSALLLGRRHRTQRALQRRTLDVVAERDEAHDRWTLQSDIAMVYCVPGRCARVVFTSEALRRLDDAEQQAVWAHERAHLRCHHHHLIGAAHLLGSAFSQVPLFVQAARRTRTLVEVHADQVAARTVGPVALMSALLSLADGVPQTWPALNAGGSATAERVAFLVNRADDRHPAERPQRSALINGAVFAAVASAPLLLSALIHAAFCWV